MSIVITSKRDGFRRCGIAHPSRPTPYPDDYFTEEQLEALSKEPQLILAYAEDGFGQVQERLNEAFAQTTSSQAPDALSGALSQSLETGIAPVGGTGLVESVKELGIDLDSLWEEAHLEELAREAAKTEADFNRLWDEAHQEDLVREAAKTGAVKPPAKPAKARATKAEDESK